MTTDGRHLITNSRLSALCTCARKHWMMYGLGLRSARKSDALTFGSEFHKGLEALLKGTVYTVQPEAWESAYDYETMCELLQGYVNYWGATFEVVAVELPFEVKLSRGFALAGKIDAIVKLDDGRLAVMEHKTTSQDIGPESDYWPRLRIDNQISLYVLAARHLGYDIGTVLYDVIKKPTIKPLKATPPESRKYTKEGALYKGQRENDETPEEYALRLRTSISENPANYYARREIARTDADIDNFKKELRQHVADLARFRTRAERASTPPSAFPRNTSACCRPGYNCEFLNLCCAPPSMELPPDFETLSFVHPELQENYANVSTHDQPAAITSASTCDSDANYADGAGAQPEATQLVTHEAQ